MNDWTSVRLASRVARVFRMEESAKTRIHRVIRNFVAKDILRTEIDKDDGRSAMRFSDAEAAIALLLLPLADLAVDARGLRDVAEALRQLHNYGDEDQGNDTSFRSGTVKRQIPLKIEQGISAAAEGAEVVLSIKLRWDRVTARISRHATLIIETGNGNPESETLLSDYERVAFENLASITVPATALLNAFFSEHTD